MNENSTAIKNEIVNDIINPDPALVSAAASAANWPLYQLTCKLDINAFLRKIEDHPELFLKMNKESVSLIKMDKELNARSANKDKDKEIPPGPDRPLAAPPKNASTFLNKHARLASCDAVSFRWPACVVNNPAIR